MIVFELTYPGTFLTGPDPKWSSEIDGILSHIRDSFFDINIAFNLYEDSIPKGGFIRAMSAEQDEITRIRQALEAAEGVDYENRNVPGRLETQPALNLV